MDLSRSKLCCSRVHCIVILVASWELWKREKIQYGVGLGIRIGSRDEEITFDWGKRKKGSLPVPSFSQILWHSGSRDIKDKKPSRSQKPVQEKEAGTDFYRMKSQDTSVTLSSPLTSFLNKYVFIFWKSKPLNIPLWPGIVYFCFVFQLFLGVLETEEGRLLYRYCLIIWKIGKWLNIAQNTTFMNITVGVTAGKIWTVPGLTGSGPAMESQA